MMMPLLMISVSLKCHVCCDYSRRHCCCGPGQDFDARRVQHHLDSMPYCQLQKDPRGFGTFRTPQLDLDRSVGRFQHDAARRGRFRRVDGRHCVNNDDVVELFRNGLVDVCFGCERACVFLSVYGRRLVMKG